MFHHLFFQLAEFSARRWHPLVPWDFLNDLKPYTLTSPLGPGLWGDGWGIGYTALTSFDLCWLIFKVPVDLFLYIIFISIKFNFRFFFFSSCLYHSATFQNWMFSLEVKNISYKTICAGSLAGGWRGRCCLAELAKSKIHGLRVCPERSLEKLDKKATLKK